MYGLLQKYTQQLVKLKSGGLTVEKLVSHPGQTVSEARGSWLCQPVPPLELTDLCCQTDACSYSLHSVTVLYAVMQPMLLFFPQAKAALCSIA